MEFLSPPPQFMTFCLVFPSHDGLQLLTILRLAAQQLGKEGLIYSAVLSRVTLFYGLGRMQLC